MFQRLMVPLDGTKGSEQAIPVAARIAQASQGSLMIVHVVPSSVGKGAFSAKNDIAVEPTRLEKHITEAEHYLATIRNKYAQELKNLPVETEVEVGQLPSTLLSLSRLEQSDLIVMCSHGTTGLKRLVFKSISQPTIRRSTIPVLVLHEHDEKPQFLKQEQPLRIIVPLDGSVVAESALAPALHFINLFATSSPVELQLLQVVVLPEFGRSATFIDTANQEYLRKEAQDYVTAVAKRCQDKLEAMGALTITTEVLFSVDVANTIARQARASEEASVFTIIAMATHGRHGLERLFMGSVTEQVLNDTTLPLLIMHPHQQEIHA